MPNALSEIREDLEKRLRELEAAVEEHAHIRAALDALKDVGTRTRRMATAPATRSGASSRGAGTRGRPRGSGARAQEALKHVQKQPGITIAELAKKMKIKANYLYRVLPGLEKDGKIKKDGKGYHPADPPVSQDERAKE
jgi:predicted Rossmann fold nucleotide-binding protein DprA/Smf involved in DNA uptake